MVNNNIVKVNYKLPGSMRVRRRRELADSQPDQDRLICLAQQVLAAGADLRPEKVAQLQEAIEKGAYRINAGKLADILLDNLSL